MSDTAMPGPPPGGDPLAPIIKAFMDGWVESPAHLDAIWGAHRRSQPLLLLTALIKTDLLIRFDRGLRPTAADYLARFPELVSDGDRALSLVYEEFCLLEERDERPDVGEFCDRYDAWRDSLCSQLNYHRELSQIVGLPRARVRFPVVGERFSHYEICSVLGQGGAAQVYLAADHQLDGRQVVLKVAPSMGLEPAILARLKHKNIVPIWNVADSPELGLRALCMPYLPGKTLESVLATIGAAGIPRRATSISDQFLVEERDEDVLDNGWRGFPARGTYTEAVAWLGVGIANALAYLHQKRIYHRDVKPANILITHQDGPLLFDFNLASAPNAPEQAKAAMNGGTPPYMAPEQLLAFVDPAAWAHVGASADIYALGLVLREMVTHRKPDLPDRDLPLSRSIRELHDRRRDLVPSCRHIRPDVPPSLDAIIAKCLEYRPEDRYATAKELSDDLRQFLDRRPTIIARSSSKCERVANFLYHRGRAVAALSALLVVGVILASLFPRAQAPPRRFDPKTNPTFVLARDLLKSNSRADWIKAKDLLEELSTLYPRTAWPIFFRGKVAGLLGDAEESRTLVAKSYEQDDADAMLRAQLAENSTAVPQMVALADWYYKKNRIPEALAQAEAARRLDPEHEGAALILGLIHQRLRRHDLAIGDFRATIELALEKQADLPGDYLGRFLAQTRTMFIHSLIVEIDERFRDLNADRDVVERLLRDFETSLELVEKFELPKIQAQPHSGTRCSLATCRATLWSDRGFLAHLKGDAAGMRAAFQEALTQFDRADGIANDDAQSAVGRNQDIALKNQAAIKAQRALATRRLEICKLTPGTLRQPDSADTPDLDASAHP